MFFALRPGWHRWNSRKWLQPQQKGLNVCFFNPHLGNFLKNAFVATWELMLSPPIYPPLLKQTSLLINWTWLLFSHCLLSYSLSHFWSFWWFILDTDGPSSHLESYQTNKQKRKDAQTEKNQGTLIPLDVFQREEHWRKTERDWEFVLHWFPHLNGQYRCLCTTILTLFLIFSSYFELQERPCIPC